MALKETLKQSLFDLVINCEPIKKYCKSSHPLDLNKVLIIDEGSVHYLKELLKPSELTEFGYVGTQGIKTKLQPSSVHLIYCIEPIDENFKSIISVLSQNPCPFLSVHIFSCGRISDSQISLIKSESKVLKKLISLREIPLTLSLLFCDLVLIDRDMRIPTLYSPAKQCTRIEQMALRLVDLFKIMNDKPNVRFYNESKFAKETALNVVEKIAACEKAIPNLGTVGNENRQSLCIIFDRFYDTLVPFIHDLTFESMIFDLLEVKGLTVEVIQSGQTFKYIMDEEDSLWADLRHKHIACILTQVSSTVQDFTQRNKIKVPEGASVSELRKIISKFPAVMPEFSRLQALFVTASRLMDVYKERNLRDIIATEQDFACNVKADGDRISENFALYYNLMEEIQSPEDKLRLISLFALKNNNGLSLALVEKLLKMSGVENIKQFVEALRSINFPIVEDTSVQREEIFRVPEDEEIAIGYNDSRFVPQIWGVLKNLFSQSLNESIYPFAGESVSISFVEETQKKNYEFGKYTKKAEIKSKKNKPRIYLIFLGGVCHAELRCIRVAQKLNPNCDIVVGTTEVFTPKTFISHLKTLKS